MVSATTRTNFISSELENSIPALTAWSATLSLSGEENLTAGHRSALRRHNIRDGATEIAFDVRQPRNALSIGSGSRGGFSQVPGTMSELWRHSQASASCMRRVSTTVTGKIGAEYWLPTLDDATTRGSIIREGQLVSEQTVLQFGQYKFIYRPYCSDLLQVTNDLIQDWLNGDSQIHESLFKILANEQNLHFTTGIGVACPLGIATAAYVAVTAGSASALGYNEILALTRSLDSGWLERNPRFMMAGATYTTLRSLLDGQGNVIDKGPHLTLAGWPVELNSDMPALATGNKSVLFGNLESYTIADRGGEATLKAFGELRGDQDSTVLCAYQHSDGGLVDFGDSSSASKHPVIAIQHP